MAEVRLDRNRYFSEVHGHRAPDDPTYKVRFFQGGKMGGKLILLPFDVHGNLVPDDGRTEPFQGRDLDTEGKPVIYQPLYTDEMRAFLAAKLLKKTVSSQPVKAEEVIEEEVDPDKIEVQQDRPEDFVDFKAWLRGEVKYRSYQLRAALKRQSHRDIPMEEPFKATLVHQLVLDDQLVTEDEVCADLAGYLKMPEEVAARTPDGSKH